MRLFRRFCKDIAHLSTIQVNLSLFPTSSRTHDVNIQIFKDETMVRGLQYYNWWMHYVLCGGVPLLGNFCFAITKDSLNTVKINIFIVFFSLGIKEKKSATLLNSLLLWSLSLTVLSNGAQGYPSSFPLLVLLTVNLMEALRLVVKRKPTGKWQKHHKLQGASLTWLIKGVISSGQHQVWTIDRQISTVGL